MTRGLTVQRITRRLGDVAQLIGLRGRRRPRLRQPLTALRRFLFKRAARSFQRGAKLFDFGGVRAAGFDEARGARVTFRRKRLAQGLGAGAQFLHLARGGGARGADFAQTPFLLRLKGGAKGVDRLPQGAGVAESRLWRLGGQKVSPEDSMRPQR